MTIPNVLPIVDGEAVIILKHGQPYGIRDRTGYLLNFNEVPRYPNQNDRYDRELDRRVRLAAHLVASLNATECEVPA